MTKKERFEYYKLVEPKLRAVFISNGFTAPSQEEFKKLDLSKKNREEFLAYFKDRWFNAQHFESEKLALELKESAIQLEKSLGSDAMKHVLGSDDRPKLQLPSSSALFQISRNIDIDKFYHHLEHKHTFIVVHKQTGAVTGGATLSTLSMSYKNVLEIIKKDTTQFEVFEIEDHSLFCKLLEDGDFKKIKMEKLFENEIYEVPDDYPLSTILKTINLYEFAEALNEGKPLISYDFRMRWYSTYKDVNEYHSFNDTYNNVLELEGYNPIDRKNDTGYVWFYAENPIQIRQELVFGNFKILKRIKIIENIYTFLSNDNV
ncbi:hypothetical protein [Flavobacterium pectinovorum]|uniref:Uncharacterized protein n=1 Tax=Flavobacterium pectinovorum TaxID=29533 RepID=A0A502E0H3_9FLAO|nr:hypothetical protein [Flavobacterium pectinovorum]TPG31087.1 hypothetical protein EAH81_27095 [Flavobacterium pectinovorum]